MTAALSVARPDDLDSSTSTNYTGVNSWICGVFISMSVICTPQMFLGLLLSCGSRCRAAWPAFDSTKHHRDAYNRRSASVIGEGQRIRIPMQRCVEAILPAHFK
ncbi:hypothetical protein BDW74DRAFT_157577 [Aspergillus multicolor]|uniref:uncharacterized protein n=1 Tax=Aspergillus multicolor TaxID=41759 RepID=UPI003CCE265F